jgi:hypothetical protein
MNLEKTGRTVCAAIFMGLATASASASIIVLDGWQLVTSTGITTQIGRLNLINGTSTLEQQVDGTGNAFVGAKFSEFGTIFSGTFTPENVVGAGDIGAPSPLSDSLTLAFSNVTGTVTALNAGGGFGYIFNSGTFLMSGVAGNYASGSMIGLGGNASSTAVIGGFSGDSTTLETIASILSLNFDLRDSSGVSLKPALATGDVLFETVTHHNTTGAPGVGQCSFNAGARCISMSVASSGDAYLVRTSTEPEPSRVPEPASLILVAFGLLALAAHTSLLARKMPAQETR